MSEILSSGRGNPIASSYDMGFGESNDEDVSTSSEEDESTETDYWFGQKYFECVIAQSLMLQTNFDESILDIDAKFQENLRTYPYKAGMKVLQARGLLEEYPHDNGTTTAYRQMMATIGKTVRQGTPEERRVILAAIRQNSGSTTAPASETSTSVLSNSLAGASMTDGDSLPRADWGQYASMLQEYGAQHGWVAKYDNPQLSKFPPKFRTILYCENGTYTFESYAKSRKEARHQAARKACKFYNIQPGY